MMVVDPDHRDEEVAHHVADGRRPQRQQCRERRHVGRLQLQHHDRHDHREHRVGVAGQTVRGRLFLSHGASPNRRWMERQPWCARMAMLASARAHRLGDTWRMTDPDDIGALLGADGPFARELPNFAPRLAQQAMARAVADAIENRDTLIAEAGTGTGKTYAYLVPALLSGERVIISTGTRALQDQLFHRDLPRVRAALGAPVKAALLKGRANYLCRYRMEQARGEARFSSREVVAQFHRVVAWSSRTVSGDLAELDDLPEDSPLFPQITSTAENC